MRSPRWSLLVLLASCEAHISDGGAGDAATGDAVADAAADSVAFGPWSPPQAVGPAAIAAGTARSTSMA
jgi:hypothetical protein